VTYWAAGSGLVPIHCPEHGMVLLPSEYLLDAAGQAVPAARLRAVSGALRPALVPSAAFLNAGVGSMSRG
jgi:hypothetical protein